MSAAHRAGDGGGYYPGGEVLGRQRQEEAAGWGAGYYPPETGRNWPGGGDMGGAQNTPYSGYDPSGWSSSGHPRPPYPPNYTVGGQGMPQQSPQNENWNMYGAHNPYQWHTAPPPPPPHNPNSGQYIAGGRQQWTGGDGQQVVYDVKDPSNQETVPRSKEANASPANAASAHPGIVKINQVLEKVVELEKEVDEYVGRKTDMSYRCLEELLTKQLLELDSVETGGLDSVRQARKEAVRNLQSILERLERKAF
uniref:BAG domain-containing protein n=1 Tax=Pyxicephalus adspersus TaxID=30357 RepID=A0AAV3ARF0_PYXAD|nr:TPA: hypothetical protein GDO54_006144 [Pyxicephalus adspersus]